MKKFIPIFLCLLLAVCCIGCSKNDSTAETNVYKMNDGSMITLYEDNALALVHDDIEYIGYVEQMYKDDVYDYWLYAVEPNLNGQEIMSKGYEATDCYFLCCPIILNPDNHTGEIREDVTQKRCLNDLFTDSYTETDEPVSTEGADAFFSEPIGSHAFDMVENGFMFTGFITMVDDKGNLLYRFKQFADGTARLFSGTLELNGATVTGSVKSDQTGYSGVFLGKQIVDYENGFNSVNALSQGTYPDTLSLAITESNNDYDCKQISLACKDSKLGVYTVSSMTDYTTSDFILTDEQWDKEQEGLSLYDAKQQLEDHSGNVEAQYYNPYTDSMDYSYQGFKTKDDWQKFLDTMPKGGEVYYDENGNYNGMNDIAVKHLEKWMNDHLNEISGQ